MSRFKMVTEDPEYNEEGILEDAEWEQFLDQIPEGIDLALEDLSPFSTINS